MLERDIGAKLPQIAADSKARAETKHVKCSNDDQWYGLS